MIYLFIIIIFYDVKDRHQSKAMDGDESEVLSSYFISRTYNIHLYWSAGKNPSHEN